MRTSIVEMQRKELSRIADKLQFVVFPDEFDVIYYSNFFSFDDLNIRWDKFPEIKEKIIEGFGRNDSLRKPKSESTLIHYIFDFVDPEFAFVLYNNHVKFKMKSNPIYNDAFNLFPTNFDDEFDALIKEISLLRSESKFIKSIIKLSVIFQHPLIFQNKERILKLENIFKKRNSLINPVNDQIIRNMFDSNIVFNPLFKAFLNYLFVYNHSSYHNMLKSALKSKKVVNFYKFRLKVYSNLILKCHSTALNDVLQVIMSYNYFDDLSLFDEELALLKTNIKRSDNQRHLRRLFLLNYNKISNEKFRDVLIEPTKYEQYLIKKYERFYF